MNEIKIFSFTGVFAENKDAARSIRLDFLEPALANGEKYIVDFENVEGATQSFIHALISELFRIYSEELLDRISFKNCNSTIQKVIVIVSEYMQEAE